MPNHEANGIIQHEGTLESAESTARCGDGTPLLGPRLTGLIIGANCRYQKRVTFVWQAGSEAVNAG